MLFNSFEFLAFFPLVTGLFFILPHKYRWLLLLLASCYFYASFVPVYLLILLFTIVVDYYAGIQIERAQGSRRKQFLVLSILANVLILAVFKYYNFFIENINQLLPVQGSLPYLSILLPIGLSFHTFQAMSYTIEVYRGHQKAEHHFGIYALYVMFYPQLVAGPIERPQNILHQFHEEKSFDYTRVVLGLRLMLWGFFKKIVIADRLALITDPVFTNPQSYPAISILLAVFFFAFQIYCDFSGYSDIAIGSARVMGYDLMKNFNVPYSAQSIGEFWTRWHISLSTWFKDYVYIPLGGNRVGKSRWFMNLFIVFLISGLWHGASWNYVIWGALHGVYLIVGILIAPFVSAFWKQLRMEKNLIKSIVHILVVFVLVDIAWVFFRAPHFSDALYMIQKLPEGILQCVSTDFRNVPFTFFGEKMPSVTRLPFYFMFVAMLVFVDRLSLVTNIQTYIDNKPTYIKWALYYALVFFIMYLGVYDNRQFIYFQF